MKRTGKKLLFAGMMWMTVFAAWTILIQTVDVQSIGPMGTAVGFASLNGWFHELTGVHMSVYHITDWLGLVPIFICMMFGLLGLVQLIRRRSLWKVDADILWLEAYDVVVILLYLAFEMFPVNFRPILIEGVLEASYPSSTTLLVLCVMPTLVLQVNRRSKNAAFQKAVHFSAAVFSVLMVLGRMISGVHWLTDIAGSVWLNMGLFRLYQSAVQLCGSSNH